MSSDVMCQPCRERGNKTRATKVVADTPMCEFCFRGEARPSRHTIVRADKTPFAGGDGWGALGAAVANAKDLPPGFAVEFDFGKRNSYRVVSNAHTYARRGGFAIQCKTRGTMLYIMRKSLGLIQMGKYNKVDADVTQ